MISISLNIGFLILAWIVYLIIQYSWSGMSKFIGLLLFPGVLIHIASHYLLSRLLGIKPYTALRISPIGESFGAGLFTSADTYKLSTWRLGLVAISPLIVSLPILIFLRGLLILSLEYGHGEGVLLLAWMIISIAVCGFPSISDLGFLTSNIIIKHPDTIIALILVPAVYILGSLAYNSDIAILGTLTYLILILIAALLGESKKEEIVVE